MKMNRLFLGTTAIAIPIVQGGMGVGISLHRLAAAVANEGGIGVISCAGLGLLYRERGKNYIESSIFGLKEEIRKAREKTKGVIGVNIMVALSNFKDMVKTAIAEKVDVIFSGAGLPLTLPSFLSRESSTKLVPIVSSARAAKVICEKWKSQYDYLPDALVLEGPKAGGHLGFKADQIFDEKFQLEEIFKEVKEEVTLLESRYSQKIPIIVAGGIYSGFDIAKMLNMGADGVQMGSRFVTTTECDASSEFKQSYINASEKDVTIIQSPVGMPGRALASPFIQKIRDGEKHPKACPFNCISTCNIEKSPYCIILALHFAYKGNMNMGYAFAGANAYKATKIMSVHETFSDLLAEIAETK